MGSVVIRVSSDLGGAAARRMRLGSRMAGAHIEFRSKLIASICGGRGITALLLLRSITVRSTEQETAASRIRSPCHRENNKWRKLPFLLSPFSCFLLLYQKPCRLSVTRHLLRPRPLRFSLSTVHNDERGSGEGNARHSKRQRGGQADKQTKKAAEVA